MNYLPYKFKFENELVLYAKEVFSKNQDPLTSFGLVPKQIPQDLLSVINRELVSLGIDHIQYIHFWRKPAFHHQPIHVDPWDWDVAGGFAEKIVPTCTAINIPMTPNASTSMFWYEGKYNLIQKSTLINSKEVRLFDIEWKSDPVVCDQLDVVGTHLLRVHKPHNVILGNKTRDLISLRLKTNPSFDKVVQQLLSLSKDKE
jgi:hypothetical protein